MKKILIPTDFTVDSLVLLKNALSTCKGQKLDVVLAYGAHLDSAICDLLFYSKKNHIQKLTNKEFNEGKAILTNRYKDQINSLSIELFIGTTQSAFKSFAEGLNISQIYATNDYHDLQINKKTGFCLYKYFKKSEIEVLELDYKTSHLKVKHGVLSKLLTS
ncbi:hypothetical protein [Leeuwenhoekiella sp. NPDC079379]|uniref:hypothetical protein n=1 Tax=Leeuwenhoekiella sp. NPDC079379 TaxID=3364122 RepID=UPI0037CB717A